jgi:hypothetical protein
MSRLLTTLVLCVVRLVELGWWVWERAWGRKGPRSDMRVLSWAGAGEGEGGMEEEMRREEVWGSSAKLDLEDFYGFGLLWSEFRYTFCAVHIAHEDAQRRHLREIV